MDEQTAKEIKHWYMIGRGSIQDLARIYKVSVESILKLVGEDDMSTVSVAGDMIDPSEAGPNADMNKGKDYSIPFSLD